MGWRMAMGPAVKGWVGGWVGDTEWARDRILFLHQLIIIWDIGNGKKKGSLVLVWVGVALFTPASLVLLLKRNRFVLSNN
jgi:hypothetical protein